MLPLVSYAMASVFYLVDITLSCRLQAVRENVHPSHHKVRSGWWGLNQLWWLHPVLHHITGIGYMTITVPFNNTQANAALKFKTNLYQLDGWPGELHMCALASGIVGVSISAWVHPCTTTVKHLWGDGICEVPRGSYFGRGHARELVPNPVDQTASL